MPVLSTPSPVRKPRKTRNRRRFTQDTNEYSEHRVRNNVAVQKSRLKMRQKTQEMIVHLNQLHRENAGLESQLAGLSKELTILREIFKAVYAKRSVELKNLSKQRHKNPAGTAALQDVLSKISAAVDITAGEKVDVATVAFPAVKKEGVEEQERAGRDDDAEDVMDTVDSGVDISSSSILPLRECVEKDHMYCSPF